MGSNVETSRHDSPNIEDRQSRAEQPRDRPFNSLIRTSYIPDRNTRHEQEIDHDDTATATGTAPTTTHSLSLQADPEPGTVAIQNTYDQGGFSTDLDGLPFDSWLVDGFGLNFNAIDLSLNGDSYRNDFFGRDTLLP